MKSVLRAIVSIATIVTALPAHSGSFVNWQPLIKDSVAGISGLEAIIPRMVLKDSDMDGVIDQAFLSFDVFTAGTNTHLFRTQQRAVLLPALPCATSIGDDLDFDFKFTNETGGRSNMIVLFNVSCTESGTFEEKEAYTTAVYSADVTRSPGAGGDSWRRAWNSDAISFNNLDWDNDAEKEIILNLAIDQTTSASVKTIILRQSDGTIEAGNFYRLLDVQ